MHRRDDDDEKKGAEEMKLDLLCAALSFREESGAVSMSRAREGILRFSSSSYSERESSLSGCNYRSRELRRLYIRIYTHTYTGFVPRAGKSRIESYTRARCIIYISSLARQGIYHARARFYCCLVFFYDPTRLFSN